MDFKEGQPVADRSKESVGAALTPRVVDKERTELKRTYYEKSLSRLPALVEVMILNNNILIINTKTAEQWK